MKLKSSYFRYSIVSTLLLPVILSASNLANPLAPIPSARIGIGVSYHLGGYTLTNRKIPALFNRIYGRISYSPIPYFNIGFDIGATQIEVASDPYHTPVIGAFHGNYKFSYGGYIKLTTPLLRDIIGIVGIAHGTHFISENDMGALYQGYDGAGAAGLLIHIPGFGYISAGSKLYLIKGESKSYHATAKNNFSNVNNIQGWLALDYFPKMEFVSKNIPHITFEVSITPDVKFNDRAPVQEITFSIAIGTITKRLYGEKSAIEWEP